MKRMLALLLALAMCLSLAACGKKDDGFQARYDELLAELADYGAQCDYAAEIYSAGCEANRPTSKLMEGISQVVISGGWSVALSLGQYESLNDAVEKGEVSSLSKGYEALKQAARMVDPGRAKEITNYANSMAGTRPQEAEDETMEICRKLYAVVYNYTETGITDRVSALQEEFGEKHEAACQNLLNLSAAVGLYTLEIMSPSNEFQARTKEYHDSISKCLSFTPEAAQ